MPPIELVGRSGGVIVLRNGGPEVEAEGLPVEPVEVDKGVRPWLETRIYKLRVTCPSGREHRDTLIVQSSHLPIPVSPSPDEVAKYNAAKTLQNESDEGEIKAGLATLRLKCTEWAIPRVSCSIRWTDTSKRFASEIPATFYELKLVLEVATPGEMNVAKRGTREWTKSGRAEGARSWYGCSGSAAFTVDRVELDAMSEDALRLLAEQQVKWCAPFNVPFQLT